jgi:hypothetical protein
VVGATHVRGHTLDVVIARESSQLLHDRPFIFDPILCNDKGDLVRDHMAIRSNLRILIYHEKCRNVGKLLFRCKKEYFTNKISEIGHDQKQLYKVTNNLLGKTKETVLPSIPDHYELANRFGDFFIGKIETIRDNLCASNCDIIE